MQYYPEGWKIDTPENKAAMATQAALADALREERILEARALICDSHHNLIVDLHGVRGVIPREEGAYYSTKGEGRPAPPPEAPGQPPEQAEKRGKKAASAPSAPKSGKADGKKRLLPTLRRWLVDNELEIWRRDKPVTALPVLILVLLVIFVYYLTIPLLILGLFLGFRYRFSGPDLERDSLNDVMDNVADTAADLGRQVMDELRTQSRHMADRAEEAERQVRQEKSDLEREADELERRVEEDLLGGGKKE